MWLQSPRNPQVENKWSGQSWALLRSKNEMRLRTRQFYRHLKEMSSAPALKSEFDSHISARSKFFIPHLKHPKRIRFLLLLGLVLLIGKPLSGTAQDSLAYIFRQDNLSTNNDFQLNHKFQFGNADLQIADMLFYKVFSYDDDLTNESQYSIEHRLRTDISWGKLRSKSIRMESSQHQDHRTGLASSINNWALLAGFNRSELLSIYLGGRSVERYGIVDEGWAAEMDFQKSWKSRTQQSSMLISGSRDQLEQHLNHALNAQANYLVQFGDISTYQTSIKRDTRLQAFFTDSLGSSQSRNNDNLLWQNRFVYHLNPRLHLSHQLNWGDQLTEINQEKVDRNFTLNLSSEDRKRFSLLNETALELTNPNFSTLTAFKIENSQNKYYVDYTQVLYQLKEEIHWQNTGLVDSLSWQTTLSRLEYDTPDTTNNDDRDEWRLNTEIRLTWQPSPFYHLEFGTKLGLFHLIYLFNTRSSENHWNRNLVLWSGVRWRRSDWSGEARGRIRTNYFDYDYDDYFIEADQPSRSFVHRSLDLQKRITYKIARRWSVTTKASIRWEDEGKLDWDSFIQQVSIKREESELSLKLYYDYRGWRGWIGYLAHDRKTDYAIQNRDTEHWKGKGPLFGVNYQVGNRIMLKGDARFIQVVDRDRDYVLPKVFFTLVYR